MNQVTPPPTLAVVETESALLGALMIDNRIIDRVTDRLRAEHFFDPLNRRIYKAITALHAAGDAATPITLRGYFPRGSVLDDRGNDFDAAQYLAQLTGSGAGLLGYDGFADQIVQFAMYRQVRDAALRGIDRLEEVARPQSLDFEIPDALAIATDTSAAMMGAVESRNPHQIIGMAALLRRVRARHDRSRSGVAIGALCATIPDINEIIGPAAPEQMTVIGGRSGMGKTVLACSAAWGYAVNGHPTLMISHEMSADALAMRMAADLSFGMNEGVPFSDMVRDRMTDSMLLQVDEAARRIEAYPFEAISPGRVTIEQIDAIVGRHVAKLARQGKKLEVVVVDYIQIIAATGKLEGTARINHISEGLLGIAKRYELHVIALSQLLRDIDKRPDRRPTTADLKESGRIEEDADNVLLVYRPEFYLAKEQPDRAKNEGKWQEWDIDYQASRGRADLIGAKVRMGEPQTRRLRFYGKHQAMRGSAFVEPTYKDDFQLLPADGSKPDLSGGIDDRGLGLP